MLFSLQSVTKPLLLSPHLSTRRSLWLIGSIGLLTLLSGCQTATPMSSTSTVPPTGHDIHTTSITSATTSPNAHVSSNVRSSNTNTQVSAVVSTQALGSNASPVDFPAQTVTNNRYDERYQTRYDEVVEDKEVADDYVSEVYVTPSPSSTTAITSQTQRIDIRRSQTAPSSSNPSSGASTSPAHILPSTSLPNSSNMAAARQQELINRARQNSNTPASQAPVNNGDDLPAFRRLMDTGVQQLRQGDTDAAQSTFTRAQRLAPQSSAVYFYLAQVALKKNQPFKSEAMARRGLVVAEDTARKQALWQIILRAAQMQGNLDTAAEAQAVLLGQ